MGEINHEKEHFSLSVTDIWQLSWKSLSQSPNSDRIFFSGCQNISNCPSIEIFRFGELLLTIIVNFKKLNKWSFFWFAHNDIPFISDDWMIDVFQFTSLLAQGRISNPVPSFLSLYQVFPVFHHSSLRVMQLTHQLSH